MTYECKRYSYSAITELEIKLDRQSNDLDILKKLVKELEE